MFHISKYAKLPLEKYRLDSVESVFELSSPHSYFMKRACCARGKSSKLPAKGVARGQSISWRVMLEAKWEEKKGFLTKATQAWSKEDLIWTVFQENQIAIRWWQQNADVISTFWILFKFIIHILKWNSDALNASSLPRAGPSLLYVWFFSNPLNDPAVWILLVPLFLDRETEIWCGYMTWP